MTSKPLPGLLVDPVDALVQSLPPAKPECPRGLSDAERMQILTDHIIRGGASNSGVPISFGDRRRLCQAMAVDPRLREAYESAMRLRADYLAEEIIGIADSDADPQRVRNQVSARTWWASKINPRRYGERLEVDLSADLSVTAALAEAKSRVRRDEAVDAEIIAPPSLSGPEPA